MEIDERDLDLGPPGNRTDPPVAPAPQDLSLRELERSAILAVLADNRGSRSLAAKTLGIHRSTLRRKLRELGIEPGRAERSRGRAT